MTPFKTSLVKKHLNKLDLRRLDSTYSLKPWFEKWLKEHPPEMSYDRKPDNVSLGQWKAQVRSLISSKLKVPEPLPLNEQKVEIHGEFSADGLKFVKLSLIALPGLRIPAILCIPENIASKAPVMICVHGHGQSFNNALGFKKSKHKEYFGIELARQGVITLSFDWIGSGEREKFTDRFLMFFRSEDSRSNWIRFVGLDMLGLRIAEVKGLLNYIETRSEIDPKRFGIVGHSGGGTISLFTSALEERIKVCCVSGYFGTWDASILAMYHCGCNYSADLRKYIEMYDVFASLAPLSVAVVAGKKDGIFPIQGTEIAVPIIQSAYAEAKHPENFLADITPLGHRFRGENVYPFILKHL